jgi:hypothetical protein
VKPLLSVTVTWAPRRWVWVTAQPVPAVRRAIAWDAAGSLDRPAAEAQHREHGEQYLRHQRKPGGPERQREGNCEQPADQLEQGDDDPGRRAVRSAADQRAEPLLLRPRQYARLS